MNTESPFISIVVPIYKVEKYLANCIESILNQEYKDFELILVDDGSPDNCGDICEKYALEDSRIKVIHKENGGLSSARNAGIDIAIGKYIGFVDSDDYIHPLMYKQLIELISKTSANIAECSFKSVDDSATKIDNNVSEELSFNIYNNIEHLNNLYNKNFMKTTIVWNKLYDINLFKDIRFPEGKVHEDEFTTHKLIYISQKIASTDSELYYYRQTPNSIMRSNFNIKRLDALEALKEKKDFFKEKSLDDLHGKAQNSYLRDITNYYYITKENNEYNYLSSKLKETFDAEYKELLKGNNISIIKKSRLGIFRVSPKLYKVVDGLISIVKK